MRAALAAAGVAIAALSIALVGRRTDAGLAYDTTYADARSSFAVLEVVAGAAVALAALLLLARRATATLGALAIAAEAAWLAPAWVGWEGGPRGARIVAALAAPLLPVVALSLAFALPPHLAGGRRVAAWVLVGAAWIVTACAAIATLLVRNPIRDPYCWTDCTVRAVLIDDDVVLGRRLARLALAAGATLGVGAAAVAAARLARARPLIRRSAGAASSTVALLGLAVATYDAALLVSPRESPTRPLYEAIFVARGAALLLTAAGLAWLAVRPAVVRGLVTRLAIDLRRLSAEGGLRPALAAALGDERLQLAYPLGGGSVDAEGRALPLDDRRRITPIVDSGGVVALVASDTADADALEQALGPAAHLAIGNERLRAQALAHLADATASRAGIVATADATRRELERDLHDGAQQRMLALTYDLQVASELARSRPHGAALERIQAALADAVAASHELREIAHGIFPAELAASGIEAALQSLADLRALRLRVELPPAQRFRPEVETTLYAVVLEALDAASGPVAAHVGLTTNGVRLTVDGVDDWADGLVRVEDRVGAAGGRLTVEPRGVDVLLA